MQSFKNEIRELADLRRPARRGGKGGGMRGCEKCGEMVRVEGSGLRV